MILKPKEQRIIKVKAQCIDEFSGLAIVKMLDGGTLQHCLTGKAKVYKKQGNIRYN